MFVPVYIFNNLQPAQQGLFKLLIGSLIDFSWSPIVVD